MCRPFPIAGNLCPVFSPDGLKRPSLCRFQQIMANKKDNNKELARILFMSGCATEDIVDKAGVCRQTLSRWINKEGWREQRAAKTITRPELVNKLLQATATLLDTANKPGNEEMLIGLGDKLIKLATTVEKLEKKSSVVDRVETVIDFENWMIRNRDSYPQLKPELIKLINQLHNDYMNSLFNGINNDTAE